MGVAAASTARILALPVMVGAEFAPRLLPDERVLVPSQRTGVMVRPSVAAIEYQGFMPRENQSMSIKTQSNNGPAQYTRPRAQ